MGTAGLIFLAAGLSMDAFAVSVCKGLSLGKIKLRHMITVGAWFGGFQALMPLIGYLLGSAFSEIVSEYDHWIACALLVFIGGNMIRESLGCDEEEKQDPSITPGSMIMPAIATSIDALAVGVTFAFLEIPVGVAVGVIGVVTFTVTAIGVKLGSLFGDRYRKGAEITGGAVLIILGIKILAEGLGWL
ncbi:MAG: manganese efflux pump MntP family protein [Oscillospiraceae bacterium]|nr:manganese efflux pump MntP family protein [Oscillospiraceae bacterium]